MREERIEVLVVGAGPVGLMTALTLAQGGVESIIIDREPRTTARSYACALHPRVLDLLATVGVADDLIAQGRKIESVAFYEKAERRARVRVSDASDKYPFLLVLPQSVLESTLEARLNEAGVKVRWHRRFDDMAQQPDAVEVMVEELEGTTGGYAVPHWEELVKRRTPIYCRWLVGADGPNSLVRRRLGLDFKTAAPRQFFAAYEFEPEGRTEDELRIVLDSATTNVLWPLPGNKMRWTFEIPEAGQDPDFPEKERRAIHFSQKIVDDEIRRYVETVAKHRAPWFASGVKEITWCTQVSFQPRVAAAFGQQNAWLAGDSAHQAGPAAAQSMNQGLLEAASLAEAIIKIQKDEGDEILLAAYAQTSLETWQRMLGLTGAVPTPGSANPWIKANWNRILPSLPATGEGLAKTATRVQPA
jgi:2-polyprenyl-6-methoxyphenol hydroxylase-like FAD-dependent oxidoreductase